MGEDVDLVELVADLRRLQRDEASQAADTIEAWAHVPAGVRRLAGIVRDGGPIIAAAARQPEPAKWTLWGFPAVEWDLWPHRIRLGPGDGDAVGWAVLTVQLGRGSNHGSYAFDGSVSPASGAAPTAADAARAALAAIGVEPREPDMGSDPSDDHSTHVHFSFGNLNDYKLLPSTGVLGMRRVVVTSCTQCGAPLVRPVT